MASTTMELIHLNCNLTRSLDIWGVPPLIDRILSSDLLGADNKGSPIVICRLESRVDLDLLLHNIIATQHLPSVDGGEGNIPALHLSLQGETLIVVRWDKRVDYGGRGTADCELIGCILNRGENKVAIVFLGDDNVCRFEVNGGIDASGVNGSITTSRAILNIFVHLPHPSKTIIFVDCRAASPLPAQLPLPAISITSELSESRVRNQEQAAILEEGGGPVSKRARQSLLGGPPRWPSKPARRVSMLRSISEGRPPSRYENPTTSSIARLNATNAENLARPGTALGRRHSMAFERK